MIVPVLFPENVTLLTLVAQAAFDVEAGSITQPDPDVDQSVVLASAPLLTRAMISATKIPAHFIVITHLSIWLICRSQHFSTKFDSAARSRVDTKRVDHRTIICILTTNTTRA